MSASYFIMRGPSDPKIVGVKNGGSQARIDRDGFLDKSNYDRYVDFFTDRSSAVWSKIDKIPDFEFTLECVRLEKNAKLTDFLSYYPEAFRANHLVSERAVQVMERLNLPEHKKYPAKVFTDQTEFVPYYLIYFPSPTYDIIDFQSTIFYKGDELIGKDYISISSPEEYVALKRKTIFDIEKLVLTKNFDNELDIFSTKVTYEFMVSSKFKKTIEDEKLTGINFIEAKGPRQMSIVIE